MALTEIHFKTCGSLLKKVPDPCTRWISMFLLLPRSSSHSEFWTFWKCWGKDNERRHVEKYTLSKYGEVHSWDAAVKYSRLPLKTFCMRHLSVCMFTTGPFHEISDVKRLHPGETHHYWNTICTALKITALRIMNFGLIDFIWIILAVLFTNKTLIGGFFSHVVFEEIQIHEKWAMQTVTGFFPARLCTRFELTFLV